MNCLIGIHDADLTQKTPVTPQTNKIGGTPDWPDRRAIVIPVCGVCKKTQTLVVQLYCCLGESSYHRNLYLFACTNPACWNTSESWTVYRCQWKTSESTCSNLVKESAEKDWCGDVDDWGTGDSVWGVDSEDWGEDAMDLSNLVTDTKKHLEVLDSTECSNETLPVEEDCAGHCDLEIQQLSISDNTDDVTGNVIKETDDDVTCNHGNEDASGNAPILAEDMPALSDTEKSEALKKLQTCCNTVDIEAQVVLKSFYISVFEEPGREEEDHSHETKLLTEYQQREGCSVKDLIDVSRGSKSGKGESYEKSSLPHRDVVFHKFKKRLSRCPQQCVRYEWNGSPLFISALKSAPPVKCGHCGGPIVFELQLMPALVNWLRTSNSTGSVLEFGTVLVYTCRQSCWSDTDLYKTEQVFVQPDPDEYLFR